MTDFDPPARWQGGGRPRRYPWDTWLLPGVERAFLQGRDFDCEPAAFQKQLQAALRERRDKPAVANMRTKMNGKSVRVVLRRYRASHHDWERLMDGKVHVLRRDVDFFGSHNGFIRQARRAAGERDLLVRSRTRGNDYYREVAIRAIPKEGETS